LRDFGRKQFSNGRWVAYQAALTSVWTISGRHCVPLAFVVALIISVVSCFAYPTTLGPAFIVITTAPYFSIATIIGKHLANRSRFRPDDDFVSWYLFPLLLFYNHVCYGFGTLWGLATCWKIARQRKHTKHPKLATS
jgi:hypothetical protein